MKKIIFALLFLSNQQFAQTLDTLNQINTSRTEVVFYEIGAGAAATVVTFLPTAFLIKSIANPKDVVESIDAIAITTLMTLTFGGSLGVHIVDKGYNKNSSYLLALGGSFVGLVVGYGVLLAIQPIEGNEALIGLVAPLTFSILAVNLINYENMENRISINYQPEIMFNSLIHNINFRINL